MISLVFAFLFLEFSLFFNSKIKNPPRYFSISKAVANSEEFNIFSFFDIEAANIYCRANKDSRKKRFSEVSEKLLFYHVLKCKNREIDFVMSRAELPVWEIMDRIKNEAGSVGTENIFAADKIISESLKIANEKGKDRIGVGDILTSFAFFNEYFQNILNLNGLAKEDIQNLVLWFERVEERISKSKKFWERENLAKKGSIGKDWSSGYSLVLDKYSNDLREALKKSGLREIVGHNKEIDNVERILEKQEINNVLLVGEPGTGRESIVLALAQKAFLGNSLPNINHKRVVEFDIGQLAAEVNSPEEVEMALNECFSQCVRAGNVIVVIKEIHNFFTETAKPGAIDISAVISRYLPLSSFQIVATTSFEGLHSILERRPSILNLFEKVGVEEISDKETMTLLENFLPFFEKKNKKIISYKALKEIILLSSKYFSDIPFPEKAIRLLDESMSWLVKFGKEKILLPEHIRKIVSEKSRIPVETMGEREKSVLLNLENLIHEKIINQEEAVKEVSSALRRARAEVQTRSGPIGGFLFLGPTGVGKTETSKAIAAVYFGSERKMIRIDMSEFQALRDIKRLIGGDNENGYLITQVRENPFSLILLDEMEKAHPNILNLFLQVLDEGWMTDGFGRKISFKNTMVVATSNAGAEVIREDIKNNKQMNMVKEDLLDYLLKSRIFKPEFINRFDAIVVFKPLEKNHLLEICRLLIKKATDNLKNKGIKMEVDLEAMEEIVELSYSPQFGAREMRRVIQDKIENLLAQAILKEDIKRGSVIKIKVEEKEFKLIIEKKL